MKINFIAMILFANLALSCGSTQVSSNAQQSQCIGIKTVTKQIQTKYNICKGYGQLTMFQILERTKTICSGSEIKVSYTPWIVKVERLEGLSANCP